MSIIFHIYCVKKLKAVRETKVHFHFKYFTHFIFFKFVFKYVMAKDRKRLVPELAD